MALADTLARVVAEIKGVTRVVTGHEEGLADTRDPSAASVDISTPRMMRWADVEEYADFTRDFVAAVRKARAAREERRPKLPPACRCPTATTTTTCATSLAAVEAIYKEDAR